MALPSISKNDIGKHLYWILHHGKFANQIEWKVINDDTETSCLVSEDFQYSDYQEDPFWKNVMTNYQNDMFVFAIALGETDPMVTLRVSTRTYIDSTELKKLCFVFHRNDNGRKFEPMERETVINIRDSSGAIAAKSVLTGLHGYNIRGKIEIPDNLDSFRIEFKTSFNCKTIPSDFIPSCITAISDMWLEEKEDSWEKIESLNDTSDPEPESPDPDPNPEGYAHAISPEVPHGVPYEKIWFNEEGLAYRGDHVFATEIDVSDTDVTSIKDKLNQVIKTLPDLMTPDKVSVTDNESHVAIIEEISSEDLDYLMIMDDDDLIELKPIP